MGNLKKACGPARTAAPTRTPDGSDKTYLDGIDLGDDVDYDELVKDEFPGRSTAPAKLRWTTIAGIVVLFFFLAALLKIFL